jgi:hypothetical protein
MWLCGLQRCGDGDTGLVAGCGLWRGAGAVGSCVGWLWPPGKQLAWPCGLWVCGVHLERAFVGGGGGGSSSSSSESSNRAWGVYGTAVVRATVCVRVVHLCLVCHLCTLAMH